MSRLRTILSRIAAFAYACYNTSPVVMTVIRRYIDAKGNYIGELYLHEMGKPACMIGMTCDTFPFEVEYVLGPIIDTDHEFTDPMPMMRMRVGAMTPDENDRIREQISWFKYKDVRVNVQNHFCETVLEGRHNV